MDDVQGAGVLAELSELRRRVAELEERAAAESPSEERSTRRGMLRLAGAAVVGGAAASILGAQPAAAAGTMQYGFANEAVGDGTSLNSSTAGTTFRAFNSNSIGTALRGDASTSGTAIYARLDSPTTIGVAVSANVNGTDGFAMFASGGTAQLLLDPMAGTAAPAAGIHAQGEIVSNAAGFFGCVVGGNPGTWRKLAGSATAGAFHALTPTRVYDSRAALPAPGLLASGTTRTISVANGRDGNGTVIIPDLVPVGATAVAANITVTGTTGFGGFLSVNPGGNTSEASSTINWFGAGQNLANGVSLTLNANRQLTVVCGAGGGSTHFIVDIAGYYL